MRIALPLLIALLAGCGSESERRQSTVDYHSMNLRALGPAKEIKPEPIKAFELSGIGPFVCVVAGEAEREVLFVATPSIGAMRLRGENVRFSPTSSDEPLPHDIAGRFTGQSYTVELSVDPRTETSAGPDLAYFIGRMTVRDQYDRIVFEHGGRVECGAGV